jgi:hypothetical protein
MSRVDRFVQVISGYLGNVVHMGLIQSTWSSHVAVTSCCLEQRYVFTLNIVCLVSIIISGPNPLGSTSIRMQYNKLSSKLPTSLTRMRDSRGYTALYARNKTPRLRVAWQSRRQPSKRKKKKKKRRVCAWTAIQQPKKRECTKCNNAIHPI